MHELWEISEIRAQIFEHFSIQFVSLLAHNIRKSSTKIERRTRQATLLSLAQTTRLFSADALDILWRCMHGLQPLFKLLPNYRVQNGEIFFSENEISPDSCSRYLLHSKRIRYLYLSNRPGELLSVSQYRALVSYLHPEKEHLLPWLQVLCLSTYRINNYDFLDYLCTDKIQLHLILQYEASLYNQELMDYIIRTQSLVKLKHSESPIGRELGVEGQLMAKIIAGSPHLSHLYLDYLSEVDRIPPSLNGERSPLKVFGCNFYEVAEAAKTISKASESIIWLGLGFAASEQPQTLGDEIYLPASGFPKLQKIKCKLDNQGIEVLKALFSHPLPSLHSLFLELWSDISSNSFQTILDLMGKIGIKMKDLSFEFDCRLFPRICDTESIATWIQNILDKCSNLTSLGISSINDNPDLSIPVSSHTNLRQLYLKSNSTTWLATLKKERFPQLERVVVSSNMNNFDPIGIASEMGFKFQTWNSRLSLESQEMDISEGYDFRNWL